MDLKALMVVFTTVFLAELGDKTQLATVVFAARSPESALLVFAAASLALVCAAGLGVLGGALVARYIDPRALTLTAGVAFVVIGLWTIVAALRG
ncbi:MAG TPA: TMEM165/GDT1 family protein [Steroidobacteraceae bacterium]|nr:TMEM165/GDT1 family protein [Steroidobacteraceae bacterium]